MCQCASKATDPSTQPARTETGDLKLHPAINREASIFIAALAGFTHGKSLTPVEADKLVRRAIFELQLRNKSAYEIKPVVAAAKHGVLAFLWLELIDASFSVDGVVGAFAITNDPILIMIGCGLVGAMTVRDATVYLVETNKLDSYEFLEPAAMWAILALVAIMFTSAFGIEVPEVVAGGISIAIIIAGVVSSIRKNGLHSPVSVSE